MQLSGRYRTEPVRSALVWMENDGRQGFTKHAVIGAPKDIISFEIANILNDPSPELIGGSFNECGFGNPPCGPVGHRLVVFNIARVSVATPSVGGVDRDTTGLAMLAIGAAAAVAGAWILASRRRMQRFW
ncbi:MAG: hypothetical protein FJ319_14640 [SAR202 cluster bacterium]|nr:hypothetical protein [SAR202 cluster bacterium]